ncbi:MAG: peroxiredoxin family protein [Candidatus Binataceae bacterium]
MAEVERQNASAEHDVAPDEPALGAVATTDDADVAAAEPWQVPPTQPLRVVAAIVLLAASATCYGYTLLNFWSSPALGIHMRVLYPAYLLIALSLILGLSALRIALGLWSPHAKLAIAGIALLACLTFGVGGGRFVSYTLRGTLNPTFKLKLDVNDRFPDFKLADQNNQTHDGDIFRASPRSLVVVYRGDFDPFARFELGELSRMQEQFRKAGVQIVAVSADPPQRSTMLAHFLRTQLPLLSDPGESLLGALGLVQRYSNGQPDSAIPAFFLVDREHRVKWIFTSRYYREQPSPRTILDAARAAN